MYIMHKEKDADKQIRL